MRVSGLLIPVAVAMSLGCGDPPNPGRDGGDVLTLPHFLAEAHRRALECAEADEKLRGLYAAVRDSVVRVHVKYDAKDPGRTTTDHGCGVIIGGGQYVATAGHVVDAIDNEVGAKVTVVLTDGRVVPAKVVAWRDLLDAGRRRDWALLRLIDPPSGLISLEFGEATPGAPALLLGYPSQIGIAPTGETRHDRTNPPRALAPVAYVVRVKQTVNEDVRPLAGATLGNGLSGSPLVSSGRRVVGIQHRVTTHHKSEDSWVTYNFDNTWDLQQVLRKELAK